MRNQKRFINFDNNDNNKLSEKNKQDNRKYCYSNLWKNGISLLDGKFDYFSCARIGAYEFLGYPVELYHFQKGIKLFHGTRSLNSDPDEFQGLIMSGNEYPIMEYYSSTIEKLNIDEIVNSEYPIQYHISKQVPIERTWYSNRETVEKYVRCYNCRIEYTTDRDLFLIAIDRISTVLALLNIIHQYFLTTNYQSAYRRYNGVLKYYNVQISKSDSPVFIDDGVRVGRYDLDDRENINLPPKYNISFRNNNQMIKFHPMIISNLESERYRFDRNAKTMTYDLFDFLFEKIIPELDIEIAGFGETIIPSIEKDMGKISEIIIGNATKYLKRKSTIDYNPIIQYPKLIAYIRYLSRFRNIDFDFSSGDLLDQITWSLILNDSLVIQNRFGKTEHRIMSCILLLIQVGLTFDMNNFRYNQLRKEFVFFKYPSYSEMINLTRKFVTGNVNIIDFEDLNRDIKFRNLIDEILDYLDIKNELNLIVNSIMNDNNQYMKYISISVKNSKHNLNKNFIQTLPEIYRIDSTTFIEPTPINFDFLGNPPNRYPLPKINDQLTKINE